MHEPLYFLHILFCPTWGLNDLGPQDSIYLLGNVNLLHNPMLACVTVLSFALFSFYIKLLSGIW